MHSAWSSRPPPEVLCMLASTCKHHAGIGCSCEASTKMARTRTRHKHRPSMHSSPELSCHHIQGLGLKQEAPPLTPPTLDSDGSGGKATNGRGCGRLAWSYPHILLPLLRPLSSWLSRPPTSA